MSFSRVNWMRADCNNACVKTIVCVIVISQTSMHPRPLLLELLCPLLARQYYL